jgi:hypothetical protein
MVGRASMMASSDDGVLIAAGVQRVFAAARTAV